MSTKPHRHFLPGDNNPAGTGNTPGTVPDSTARDATAGSGNGRSGSVLPPNVVELYPGAWSANQHATVDADAAPTGQPDKASETGMATAEYAIATLAAVGFAGLLVFILRSEEVRGFLLTLIRTALAVP
jgi:hypothetical protein